MGFHALRHTCATLMIAAGEHPKAVQVRMRHASIQTTMDTCAHLLPGAFQGMGDRLEAFLNGNRMATETPNSENAESANRQTPRLSRL